MDEPVQPDTPTTSATTPSGSAAVAFAVYSLARMGLFLALWAALFSVGLPPLPAALAAAVLSLPLSWLLLARQRARLAERLMATRDARRFIDPDLPRG